MLCCIAPPLNPVTRLKKKKKGLCFETVCGLGGLGKGCWLTLLGIVLPYLLKLLHKFSLLHTLLMLRVKLQMERLYLVSEHQILTTKAIRILEGKMTLLLFQLLQVKLRRGRRLKLLN